MSCKSLTHMNTLKHSWVLVPLAPSLVLHRIPADPVHRPRMNWDRRPQQVGFPTGTSDGPSARRAGGVGRRIRRGDVGPHRERGCAARRPVASADSARSSTVPGSSCTPCQRSLPCPQDADRDDECREATQRRDVLELGWRVGVAPFEPSKIPDAPSRPSRVAPWSPTPG